MSLFLAGVAALVALAALSPGCGPSEDDASGDGGENECFLAFTQDFENFTSWQHYHLDASFIPNNVHASGPRDVYINKCPGVGATEFPVGTIIVKVIKQPSPTGDAAADTTGVFAQVKRGCGYNQGGASGWEWFDLLTPLNGGPDAGPGNSVTIVWEGLTPPASMAYGGDPTECNTCHSAMAADNDSIITPALQLKDIQCDEP